MTQVVHWHRPADDRADRHDTRFSIMEGDIDDIAHRMIAKIRSQGHEVTMRGADSSGPGGSTRAYWFDVTVTGHGDPMVWEHAIALPSTDVWALAIRTYDQYLEQVDRRAESMTTWRRGQCHFNVLENNRKDLAEQVRGSSFDPFNNDERIPEYLAWLAQHWDDAEVSS